MNIDKILLINSSYRDTRDSELSQYTSVCSDHGIEYEVATDWDIRGHNVSQTLPYAMHQVGRSFCDEYIRELELAGIKHLNAQRDIVTARDKYYSHIELKAAGLPVANTIHLPKHGVTEIDKLVNHVEMNIGFPCVIKLRNLSLGYGVVKTNDRHDLFDLLGMIFCSIGWGPLMADQTDLIAQEYIADSAGKAVRVIYFNGRCLGSILKMNNSHWKTNSTFLGRTVETYPTTFVLDKLTKQVCETLNLKYAGIDYHVLPNAQKYMVCEVNPIPLLNDDNWMNVHPGVNIPEMILKYLMPHKFN